tara:strand:- start:180 stop:539 length:360 start_codon:yes stop_codon:yes gene_type:complete
MKLHHTKYKKNYWNYILSTIETDNDDQPLTTDKDKIKYLFDRFYQEYGFAIRHQGKQKAMSEWLSGLALDLPYWDQDIILLAIKLGSIDPYPSAKLYKQVTQNYWSFMANIILSFEPKE